MQALRSQLAQDREPGEERTGRCMTDTKRTEGCEFDVRGGTDGFNPGARFASERVKRSSRNVFCDHRQWLDADALSQGIILGAGIDHAEFIEFEVLKCNLH